MHKKIVASLIITSSLLYAQELKNEKFQLVAKKVDAINNIVTANGDVVVYSPSYYLSANKIIYNKENETFELFDNVLVIRNNNIQTQSNYAFVDLKNDTLNQNPLFLQSQDNKIWVNSSTSNKEKDEITLDSTIISSCDCLDPIWSIRASSADYDTQEKWLNAYNPRLYVKDVPVLYSPYIGFPTDTTRRTGLLLPTLGYSSDEGLLYAQPIFIAPADNYDIEVIPQVRTQRGYGGYVYYRYADSPDSMLVMKTGLFDEYDDYFSENNLENQKHYGFNLDYKRRNLIAQDNAQDGFFTSLKYLNDVEYITIEEDTSLTSTEKKVESKINYFYDTPEYFGGAYGRYYIDGSKTSNATTLQEIPHLQFHSYNKELLNSLVYSINTNVRNYTRDEGLTATIYDVSLPISYSKYFLDDYMYAFIENRTIVSKYDYNDYLNTNYEDGTLAQNRTSVGVGSDLISPYENYLHTVNLKAEYIVPKNLSEDGDLLNITVNEGDSKYASLTSFPTSSEEKNIKLSANQSLYENSSLKQWINHKVSQSILYDSLNEPKLEDLENYARLNHDYGSISGKTVYNVNNERNVENSADSTFTYNDLSLSIGYYQSKESNILGDVTGYSSTTRENLESYRIGSSYKISKDYRVLYSENYNLQNNIRSRQTIALNVDDSCWNLDLRFEKKVIPSSSLTSDSKDQNIVFVTVLLKPIGGIKQKYAMNEEN